MRLFMTLGEVAEILGIHRKTVYRLIEDGEFVSVHIGGSHKVLRSSFEDYLQRLTCGDRINA